MQARCPTVSLPSFECVFAITKIIQLIFFALAMFSKNVRRPIVCAPCICVDATHPPAAERALGDWKQWRIWKYK